jgi:hypothetical protein
MHILTSPSGVSDQMSERVSVLLLPKWNSNSPYFQIAGVLCLCDVPPTQSGSPNNDRISSRVQPNLTGQMSPVSPNFVHHDLNASEGMDRKLRTKVSDGGGHALAESPEASARRHSLHWLVCA